MSGPIVAVAGMHRSGTSLFARFLNDSGIDLGERLHVDLRTNPYGHYEDEDFLELQRGELARAFGGEDYRVAKPFQRSESFDARARALLERKRAHHGDAAWGWKDPRTTLFLDFWRELVPELHVVGLLRPPRDVLDSLCRRTRAYFSVRRKDHLLRVITHYNQALLEHARSHPDHTHVVDLPTLLAHPRTVLEPLSARLGVELDAELFAGQFDGNAMSRSRRASVLLHRRSLRAACEVHGALEACAVTVGSGGGSA